MRDKANTLKYHTGFKDQQVLWTAGATHVVAPSTINWKQFCPITGLGSKAEDSCTFQEKDAFSLRNCWQEFGTCVSALWSSFGVWIKTCLLHMMWFLIALIESHSRLVSYSSFFKKYISKANIQTWKKIFMANPLRGRKMSKNTHAHTHTLWLLLCKFQNTPDSY